MGHDAERAWGSALLALGAWESDPARLTEAVAAYREALKERTREKVPLQWAHDRITWAPG